MNENRKLVAWALTIGIVAFSVLFFFQYKDPMILIFGSIAATMVWLVTTGAMRRAEAPVQVYVRCTGCRQLNGEEAKFCASCGRAL